MSNELTNSMRRLQVTPSQKAVLMSLCDGAADSGEVPQWRSSLAALAEWTCLSRTAVIEALKTLQAARIIEIDRSFGRVSRIKVLQASAQTAANQSASRTSTDSEPVRQTDHHQSASRTTPVRQTDGTRPADGPLTPIHQTPDLHLGSTDSEFWKAAVGLLGGAGTDEEKARSFLGSLLKDHGKEALHKAILVAIAEQPVDPKAYLRKVCGSKQRAAPGGHTGFNPSKYEEVPDGRIPA